MQHKYHKIKDYTGPACGMSTASKRPGWRRRQSEMLQDLDGGRARHH